MPNGVAYCKFCDTLKIGKVQYRALKYVFHHCNCSYDMLRRRANVPLLCTRRRTNCFYWKYIKPTILISLNIHLKCLRNKRDEYYTRNSKALVQYKCNSTTYKLYSFEGARMWNKLDLSFRSAGSAQQRFFKWYVV